jgi:hypothetical protein
MAQLCIESLYRAAWTVFSFQHDEALADRDELLTEIEESLGPNVASDIQRHVGVALGRIQADETPNPAVTAMSEFFDLLAAEMAVQEIADRISANAVFIDSDDGLLPWKDNVLPLLDGRNPGKMAVENVKKVLRMVRMTDGSADEFSDDVQGKRRELVGFLERAVKVQEPIWCEL